MAKDIIIHRDEFPPELQFPFRLNFEDRVLISELIQKSYKEGFLNGITLRKDDLLPTINTNQNTVL
jgi:hypothetical protein